MKPFPWAEVMEFGFGILRLNSNEFWNMTPRELAAAHRVFAPNNNMPIDRNSFENLMKKYPDEELK